MMKKKRKKNNKEKYEKIEDFKAEITTKKTLVTMVYIWAFLCIFLKYFDCSSSFSNLNNSCIKIIKTNPWYLI